MDLEPCFKVHNLVVIQLNNTKLGQMTNLNMIFYMVVSIYKLDQICNLPQSPWLWSSLFRLVNSLSMDRPRGDRLHVLEQQLANSQAIVELKVQSTDLLADTIM